MGVSRTAFSIGDMVRRRCNGDRGVIVHLSHSPDENGVEVKWMDGTVSYTSRDFIVWETHYERGT